MNTAMNDSQGENPTDTSPGPSAPPNPRQGIVPGNWFPDNFKYIEEKLADPAALSAPDTPVAVFDFDNTCIYRDIGQAVFRYQLFALRYRIAPETLSSILPDEDFDLDGRPLKVVTQTIISLYSRLWPYISTGQDKKAFELAEYEEFTTLLLWFTDKARKDNRLGPRYVLPLLTKLLCGFSTTELEELTEEVIEVICKEPLETKTVSAILKTPIGPIETSYEGGMNPFAEMRELMQLLQTTGFRCNVISASTHWLVCAAARVFGFPLSADQIFGIQTIVDEQGILTIAERPQYPLTFREGKVEIIQKYIAKPLLFVAGDADTDFEMLTQPRIPIRLIINRNQKGQISSLYGNPDYLLQGINTAKGSFRPSRETVAS